VSKKKAVKGYKGFNKDLTCLGKQYQLNKTFKEPEAELCERGMHFCLCPFYCFSFYGPAKSRYAEVMCNAEDTDQDDTKLVTKELKIGRELSLKEMVEAGEKFIRNSSVTHIKKTRGTATSAKKFSTIDINDSGVAVITGSNSVAKISYGDDSVASATGTGSFVTLNGNYSISNITGKCSVTSIGGYRNIAAATGGYNALFSRGDCNILASTAGNSYIHSTGEYCVAVATGSSTLFVDGSYSMAVGIGSMPLDSLGSVNARGKYSVAISNSGRADICADGYAIGLGYKCKAKGSLGAWLILSDHEDGDTVKILTAFVDGEKIQPDTWYVVDGHKIVEFTTS